MNKNLKKTWTIAVFFCVSKVHAFTYFTYSDAVTAARCSGAFMAASGIKESQGDLHAATAALKTSQDFSQLAQTYMSKEEYEKNAHKIIIELLKDFKVNPNGADNKVWISLNICTIFLKKLSDKIK